jgi:sugar lactone lactonase YvrE
MLMPARYLLTLAAMCVLVPAAPAQQGHRRAEVEPNNGIGSATLIGLGDTVSGVVNPPGDQDYFALDLTAGTHVELLVEGSVHVFNILDADGATVLGWCCESPYDDRITRIHYRPVTTGRYYVKIPGASWETGGPTYAYSLKVSVVSLQRGPGDPATRHSSAPEWPGAMAASASGDVFIVGDHKVFRVSSSGSVSEFVSSPILSGGLAFDGFGDLLATGWQDGALDGHGVIWRIAPSGTRSVFASGFNSPLAVAVGPDGDVWMSEQGSSLLRRFDPLGALMDTVRVNAYPRALAFSPRGELHYTGVTVPAGNVDYSDGLFRLVNNAVSQQVLQLPGLRFDGLAFDQDGYVYLGNVGPPSYSKGNVVAASYWTNGSVLLVSPDYQVVNNPFTGALDDPLAMTLGGNELFLVFARDDSGNMTNRLLGTRYGAIEQRVSGRIVHSVAASIMEMNRAGVRAPGARVGTDLLPVGLAGHRSGALGVLYADTLRMSNAPGAVNWTIESGTLPPGVTLTAATGVLTGIPSATGSFTFSARAHSGSRFGFGRFTVSVGTSAGVSVSVADIANALMGGGPLSAADIQYLDSHGNNNGMLDVGDLRAYLRAQGQLGGSHRP